MSTKPEFRLPKINFRYWHIPDVGPIEMGGGKWLEAVRQSDWKRPIAPWPTGRLC
jgi:hypothetical protein